MSEPDFNVPYHSVRSAMKVRWDAFPRSTEAGFKRGRYNVIAAQNCVAGLVELPAGQGSPIHSFSGEHIILMIEGQIEFSVAGEEYVISPQDLLFLPANKKYEYRNVGNDRALFLSVVGRVEEWPPTGTYE